MTSPTSIQKLLSKEDCEKILKRSIDVPFQFLSNKITKFNENVAGFLGDHFKLSIKFIANNVVVRKTYFMKTVPQFNLNQLDYVTESGIFKKEQILYQNLLSELLKIGHFGPKCFFVKDNLIVLEDLQARGFQMLPKTLYLDQDHCISMLNTLAKYHSSTLIYEKKRGIRLDQKFTEEIKETCFCYTEGQPRYKWLVSSTKCVMDLMKMSVECDEKIYEKLKKFIFEEMPKYLSPSKKFRNVLTHDDLWCNNLLFNDKKECIFIDFQLVRYAPPSFDFLVALFLNLDCVEVHKNLNSYVNIYYSFFEDELKKHNLSNNELPKEEFEESLQVYMLPALIENVMYGTHIYISEELGNQIVEDFNAYNEFSFINRSKYAVKEFQDNPRYRERLVSPFTLLANILE